MITQAQAFVLHCRHTTMCMYYAKLPNEYLQEIVRLGANYSSKSTINHQVALRRSRKFHMTNIEECLELFTLFAQLLTYLVSGSSHVGYLHNYPENPIHKIVQFSFLNTYGREIPTLPRRP